MSIRFSYDHVGLTVTPDDLDATIEWYASKLGFREERRFASHGTTFVFLIAGTVKVELMTGASTRQGRTENVLTSMDPARLHHFCVAVDDLDAAVAHLAERGVPLIGGPMEVAAIGQRLAFITDNLGTIIELAEPGTAAA